MLFAVLADGAASIPTVRKAWRDPHSENALFYLLVGAGSVITLLTITDWRPASWMFAGYILVLAVSMTTVIAVRRARSQGARSRTRDGRRRSARRPRVRS